MSASEPVSFDLVDQPWLLARQLDGAVLELSVVDTLRRAHQLAGLAGDVPTQVFALTRLLLAILHGAVNGPRDLDHWESLWGEAELPTASVEAYLERHRDRFDLFHPSTPFMQVAELRTATGSVSGLNKLIADIPAGHQFFTMRLGGAASLSFAEAARWVVHCHAFDPSGIKSGAVGDSRVKMGKGFPIGTGWSGQIGGVLPEGQTLRDTLLLNLMARDLDVVEHHNDRPAWERAPVGPGEEVDGGRTPTGPVDLYTWQSRRLRLVHDGARVVGVLICNGERITPQDKQRFEPHTAWRRSKAQEKKLGRTPVYMPRQHDPERVVWRGLQPLLPGAEKPQDGEAAAFLSPGILEWVALVTGEVIDAGYPIRLHTVGMTYGSQSATVQEIVDDRVAAHAVLFRRNADVLATTAVKCVRAAEGAAQALGKLATTLAEAAGRGRDEREGPGSRAVESAYAELDPEFRRWLWALGADTDPGDAERQWHVIAYQAILRLGNDVLARAPLTAWAGRVVDGKRFVTSAHAQRWFRAELSRTLPLSYVEPAHDRDQRRLGDG